MSRSQKLEYIKLLFDTFCITWLLWPLLWLVTSRSSCSSIAMSLPRLVQNLSVYLGVTILTAVLSLPLSQLPLLPYIYIIPHTLPIKSYRDPIPTDTLPLRIEVSYGDEVVYAHTHELCLLTGDNIMLRL